MPLLDFDSTFATLTGNKPFPWQKALFERFISGRPDHIPASCNLPTGLGKTSILAIWLIALTARPNVIPRRLVYVVNRRTVVDQTTTEAERLRLKAADAGVPVPAISTLRGQYADNREWSADPSRPAIICGTVDMIGSRLLFSGYGVGRNARPLHAGFLSQDALLVHDEAHLEPAFQVLIQAIEKEQKDGERFQDFGIPKLKVMELTATSRGRGEPFGLGEKDAANPEIQRRISAKKSIVLHRQTGPKLAEQIADLALAHRASKRPILVFVRTVEDVLRIRERLATDGLPVEALTGTLRGKERDELASKSPIFARFLPSPQIDAAGTVYLICTAAGEVGVNISADHLVSDLSTFDSMAQRLGRVNRFGRNEDSRVDVVHPASFDHDEYGQCRQRTLKLLNKLQGDGSPLAISKLEPDERQAAFAPTPTILPTSDILFDAWTLTSIRKDLPIRPHVEPYLHGLATEWQPPETWVAWRSEVDQITGNLLEQISPDDLLESFPLKPHELLKEPTYRAARHFELLAKRCPDDPAWIVDDLGQVEIVTINDLVGKQGELRLRNITVVLPPSVGGLNGGMLDGASAVADDAGDTDQRIRIWSSDPRYDEKTKNMRLIRRIEFASADDQDVDVGSWDWFDTPVEAGRSSQRPVAWDVHVHDVVEHAKSMLDKLPLSHDVKTAIVLAARLHDHGKRRGLFQKVLGNNRYPKVVLAKSGRYTGKIAETYRHEFGSLADANIDNEFQHMPAEMKDLVLHLIAAHHGRARPHFSTEEIFDPERDQKNSDALALSVSRRFGRLQRQYGRWGLAYLESLLRAADWAASKDPSQYLEVQK